MSTTRKAAFQGIELHNGDDKSYKVQAEEILTEALKIKAKGATQIAILLPTDPEFAEELKKQSNKYNIAEAKADPLQYFKEKLALDPDPKNLDQQQIYKEAQIFAEIQISLNKAEYVALKPYLYAYPIAMNNSKAKSTEADLIAKITKNGKEVQEFLIDEAHALLCWENTSPAFKPTDPYALGADTTNTNGLSPIKMTELQNVIKTLHDAGRNHAFLKPTSTLAPGKPISTSTTTSKNITTELPKIQAELPITEWKYTPTPDGKSHTIEKIADSAISFKIQDDLKLMETTSNKEETFVAMLKAYKQVYGDSPLPEVGTDPSLKTVWEKACTTCGYKPEQIQTIMKTPAATPTHTI